MPRLCNSDDDVSVESDFDMYMEVVWDDVDGDDDLMSM